MDEGAPQEQPAVLAPAPAEGVDEEPPLVESQSAPAAEPGVWTHTDRPVAAPSAWTTSLEPEAPPAEEPTAPAAEEAVAPTVVAPTLPPPPPVASFVPPVEVSTPDASASLGTEPDPTRAFAATPGPEADATPGPEHAEDEAIFRPYAGTLAGRLAASSADQDDEERKLAAERSALREARAAALTTAGTPEPAQGQIPPVVQQVVEVKRTTDGFWGSLGLFLLRLAMAAVFGVWGVQMLLDPARTQELFAKTLLQPFPILATIVPVASLLIAISMVIGLATRYAAVGAILISVGALVLVYWGSWSILLPNDFGFYGERELLVAAAGVLLLFVGAGGWSLDGSLRRARAADKAARVA